MLGEWRGRGNRELCTVRASFPLYLTVTCLVAGCSDPSVREAAQIKENRPVAAFAEVTWSNGTKHGPARITLPDGSTKEGNFVGGKKEGIWVWRSATGDTIGTTAYSAGKLHGWLVERSGHVSVREARYDNGIANGPRITRYPDGHPASLVWFIEGHEHGPAWFWNQRDTVNIGKLIKGQYEHGTIAGTWRRYYSDGVLCNENNFANGVRHGIWTLWDRNGSVLRQVEFRNDKLVRTIVDRVPKTN